ncbi:molybdopterin-dependent oxidoreductase [Gephyromycinifex aptenodytis]|uniref:molybdopterin-dependent oxidoreductase n=1 Tax=Gephyromycinifex aptenodytis TaxID=2716227 RepID=UPI001444BA3A|nr:molybdopterin-dependent oxidoreductase [Gephyromycinifex aptenodytis]
MNEHLEPSESDERPEENATHGPSRRKVLGGTAAVAGVGAVGLMFRDGFGAPFTQPTAHGTGMDDDVYDATDVINTMCMQCNSYCTIKVRLTDPGESGASSLIRKISGNPYSPLTSQPAPCVPYDTPLAAAVTGIGTMTREARSRAGGIACLKGQAGIQTAHDARRITAPLKRVGERGSGKWKTISWEQALKEVLEGDATLGTTGLKSWWAFAPEKPVMADWDKVKDGSMTAAAFEAKWGAKLMDPKRPELGPRSNGLAILGGDRMYLIGARFGLKSFGSINQFNHGGTCGVTSVVANARSHPDTGHKRMYADIDYCDYLIVWGTEPLTAQKGPTWLAPRIGAARERGMKMVVIDPRMSKTGEKADVWVPVKPGHDAELAFAIGREIIDNKRYDEKYLRAPGKAAAKTIGEPTWTDATHLVKVDDPKRAKLSMIDLGLAQPAPPDEDGKVPDGEPVVLVAGAPVGANSAAAADLDAEAELETPSGPVKVATVFNLLKKRLSERTVEEYCEAAGVDVPIAQRIAEEFTSHGKRAAVMSYRGPAMHTNGFDAIRAIGYLNFLIGNHDWKGGHITAQQKFTPLEGRYDLEKVPGANKAWGIPITREKTAYEKTSFFAKDGYPAKRRWYPFPGNLCHEVIPSAEAGYPYSLDALFIHRHSPLNSSPGAHRQAATLKKMDKIKLLVSFDTNVGDTSAYADYVLPDLTYLERFTQESIYPSQQYKVTQLGQPTTRAFDGPRPVEWFYLELAKALKLPGVGAGAFGPGTRFDTVEDYWLKMAANVAYSGKKPVPDASAEEQQIFTAARTKALGRHFDEKLWKAAVTPVEWPKVVYVLNRGGRFEGARDNRVDGYEGEWLKARYEGLCQFYDAKVAAAKDPMTGKPFDGLPVLRPPTRADGTPVPTDGFPLQFVNWKARQHGTHRTVQNAWLREVRPSNYVTISGKDAQERGISSGDRVKLRSPSGEAEGIAHVTQAIRPGVIGADATLGHRGSGASVIEIDGKRIEPVDGYGHNDSARIVTPMHEEMGYAGPRNAGLAVNALLVDDTLVGGGGMCDPIGGGAAQLDTWVEIERV